MSQHETIFVTRSSMPPFDEYCDEIRSMWDTHVLTNAGEKHQQLESQLRQYLGVANVDLFVNGHAALECVIEAMELGADGRNEVITTPFTFASTTHAIVRRGLVPVFADVNPNDYTLDPACIEAAITPQTCAIVPVHVYGNVCDVSAIDAIAKKHGLKVIYDAAHAFGVKVNGVGIGNFGDASMFSFHATKVFNTIEGGAIAHNNDKLGERLKQWRNFGQAAPDKVPYVGGNAKMNEFAAAMGICNLRHVESDIAQRRLVAERYWELLENIPGVELCLPQQGIQSNYAYLPVLFDPFEFGASRDDVFDALEARGVVARKYFYPLTSDFTCYQGRFEHGETPIAARVAKQVLCLPLYPGLTKEQVDCIVHMICSIGNAPYGYIPTGTAGFDSVNSTQ